MESTRLPGKILAKLGEDHTILSLCLERCMKSKLANEVIVVTTNLAADDYTVKESSRVGIKSFRGSENDVLSRYYDAAVHYKADTIVRITSDCPFSDPQLIDEAIEAFMAQDADYYCNQEPFVYPDGLDIDVFSFELLERTFKEASDSYYREHVTPYMKKISRNNSGENSQDKNFNYSHLRWTVDEPEDLQLISQIYKKLNDPVNTNWLAILKVVLDNPSLSEINNHIKANEGSSLSRGEKLYKRAKRIIPGGNMLLSKRPEMFLKKGWPSYFSKASGCEIWDLDGDKYLDMSIMGIGTNTLGYAYLPVDEKVREVTYKSNMSSFNAPEEVLLAEKLVEIHPWSKQVKFARTGGEINAIAIRTARAAAAKDKVVVCGYHGWHDWYLSANLESSHTLNEHLLPGLNPNGVPQKLKGLTLTIRYNSFEDLKLLDEDKNIGVLIMEVMRSEEPKPGYLETIREKCTKNGIVLIFDECTSGFRETYGGLHLKFGITPDLATFGKALGNGYAITALIGIDEIMEYANKTFISSTFWTERIGFVAGLETLSEMKRLKSWEIITNIGKEMQNIWKNIFSKYGYEINVTGIPALSSFLIKSENSNKVKTFITQEMLRNNILATNIFYPSIAHSQEHLDLYENFLDQTLKVSTETKDLNVLLEGGEANTGFKRLN